MNVEKTIRPVRDASQCYYWSLKIKGQIIKDGESETESDAKEQLEEALKEYLAVLR